MIAEIICVGTEILMGNIINTNAAYLSEQCAGLGLSMYFQTVVGDNRERLEQTIELAAKRSDIILFSGGLGPTQDDLTKEVVAGYFQRNLIEDRQAKEALIASFQRFNKEMTANNLKQALVPEGCKVLINQNGTAPGIIMEEENCTAILLPGPPNELVPMFQNAVYPYLRDKSKEVIVSRMIKLVDVGESSVETQILDLIETQTNPTIATYAKTGEVHLRVSAKAQTRELAFEIMEPVIEELKKRFDQHIFTMEESIELEDAICAFLTKHKKTISTAESCTGGLLCGRLVNASGISMVLKEGYITYSESSKQKLLGVSEESLRNHGVVSEAVAREMAIGCRNATNSDYALSITGIAGPNGGTPQTPVGLVYIGCASHNKVEVRKLSRTSSRQKVRESAVTAALTLLWNQMNEENKCEL
ncbi:MAG: competence/damage-inducible protein A [Lachnospiraceae bacterium]